MRASAETPGKSQADQALPPIRGAIWLSGLSANPLLRQLCHISWSLNTAQGLDPCPDHLHDGLGTANT